MPAEHITKQRDSVSHNEDRLQPHEHGGFGNIYITGSYHSCIRIGLPQEKYRRRMESSRSKGYFAPGVREYGVPGARQRERRELALYEA